jgi:ubiquinone/menaquinone biosynthesis C-methylase UbiE
MSRAHSIQGVAEARTFYDDWAKTYDLTMTPEGEDYVGPALASTYLLKCLGSGSTSENVQILDAGCGTGLVGACLHKAGVKNVDGVDLSPGMLDYAEKTGAYRSLKVTDLTHPLDSGDNSYDAVICVGTFTQNHVGPEPLDEFVRVIKPGGFIVATIMGTIWVNGGFEDKVKSLEADGKVKVISTKLEDYRRRAGVQARIIVLQVQE